jgi:cytochrome c-type biogenesis protein
MTSLQRPTDRGSETILVQPAAFVPVQRGQAWREAARAALVMAAALLTITIGVAALASVAGQPSLAGDVLTLAIPAILAGALAFLSPCSLPIIAGYFTFALAQTQSTHQGRVRFASLTLAFVAGIGTTMALLGASFTGLGSFAVEYQEQLALVGGLLVIGFGLMSLFGRGFGQLRVSHRPAVGVAGAYTYGLISALGWTSCTGPILGGILTLLLSQGATIGGWLALVGGGALALLYALGLGLPLLVLVTAAAQAGPRNRVAQTLKGRGFTFTLGGRTVSFHTTALVSGVLLIVLGVMLATGAMTEMSTWLASSPVAQWGVTLEDWVRNLFPA